MRTASDQFLKMAITAKYLQKLKEKDQVELYWNAVYCNRNAMGHTDSVCYTSSGVKYDIKKHSLSNNASK